MNTSEKIAGLILDTNYATLPEEVVIVVKRAILDTMGVSLAGSLDPIGRHIIDFVRLIGGNSDSSVIGGGFRTSVVNAGLANGVILHALDYDDSGAHTQGHPSAPIFPVVFALAEFLENDGKSMIEAYVVGVELFSRLSRAMPMLHAKGWHPTSVFGTLAATATAAKLLKLDKHQIIMALGLACSQASGLVSNFGTMTKAFHVGHTASNAITAALLAKKGFTSSNDIFNDRIGFPSVYSNNNEVDVVKSLDVWGTPYALLSPGISVKRYPSCSLTHRAIDAILYLHQENDFTIEEIAEVDCRVPPRAVKVLFHTNPKTNLEAKFSMQFVIATAIIYGNVSLKHFTEENLRNPQMIQLMKKIKINVHNDWVDGSDLRPDVVTVKLNSGKQLCHAVKYSIGSALSPMTLDELIVKYKECAGTVLNNDEINKTIGIINNLENVSNVQELMSIVSRVPV